MKQLIDFVPLLIFFVIYKFHDIYSATAALLVATVLQLVAIWFLYKKIEKVQLITALSVLVFGSMTLFFNDDNFIKWKVTLVYLVFAGGLAVSQWLNKPLIKGMLGKEIELPDKIWRNINNAWIVFFALLAGVNIFIAYQYPLDVWVNFKVFGLLILTVLYTVSTGLYIYKQVKAHESLNK
ncbi:MAG: septation protein A [Enterovibrio sp.]